VFFASLDRPYENAEVLLSSDERDRAARFHFVRDRHRFIVGRSLLRDLLGRYLGCDPRAVRFGYGPKGKPSLAGHHVLSRLSFNVSHSHGTAVLAFAFGRAIGVDIERHPAPDDGDAVASHFFSRDEVRALGSLSATERPSAFLRCWTRKEAYIKARGDGLSLPLDSFDVSVAPGARPALLATRHEPLDAARWSLVDLTHQCPGYVAALAIEGDQPTVISAYL